MNGERENKNVKTTQEMQLNWEKIARIRKGLKK